MLQEIHIFIRRLESYIKASMLLTKSIGKRVIQGVGLILILILGNFLFKYTQGKSKILPNQYSDQKPVTSQVIPAKHVGLIDITGPIVDSEVSIGGESSVKNIIISIQQALNHPHSTGIILRINSPGSQLVAASKVYEWIREQKQLHPKKSIIAVCTSICTRASYYVASACDAIFAEESSVIGGIGLHYEQIGYVDLFKKLGLERRLITAGKHKAALDPSSPMTSEARQMMQALLNDWHAQLIEGIKVNRADRLKDLDKNAALLFSGRIWLGTEALNLGLIDGLGSIYSVSEEILKQNNLVDYSIRPNLIRSILGV